MTIIEFLLLLCIAGICGSLAQVIAGQSRGGCLASIGLGLLGAVLGTWMARSTSLPPILCANLEGRSFPVFWAILGSGLFVATLRVMTGRRTLR